MSIERTARADVRGRIVDAAARLLSEGGSEAVTTRRVSEEAGVQAPTIYRLFGDKDGLMEAVAEHVLQDWVARKSASARSARERGDDPIEDLRISWHSQIEFALDYPAVFTLLNTPGRDIPAVSEGTAILRSRIRRIADAGRLLVSEQQAMDLIHAGGVGVIQTLLATPEASRDATLVERMWDAIVAQAIAPEPAPSEGAGSAERADLVEVLTDGERALLREWHARARDRSGAET